MKLRHCEKTFIVALAIFAAAGGCICSAAEINQSESTEAKFSRENPGIIWGDTTNFLTGDIYTNVIATPLSPRPTSLRLAIASENPDSTIVLSGQALKASTPQEYLYIFTQCPRVWVGVPPFNESVTLSMTDTNGTLLPKTLRGFSLGEPVSLKSKITWLDWGMNNRNPWFKVFDEAPYPLMFFGKSGGATNTSDEQNVRWLGRAIEPAEYFSISDPGLYTLTISVRLYVIDTNMYLKPITLPPVSVNVRVEKGNAQIQNGSSVNGAVNK